MEPYNHKSIETKWQKKWEEEKAFATHTDSDKPKWYGLIEFPYPSGAGLHVGHVRSYTALDIVARKKRKEGYEVLFPMGWDAFGLPAENYAIKTGIHPSITTQENINTFRRQLKSCGFSFDWDREIDTTDPHYYKWSQWIFLKLYEKGLAYKKEMSVNWCPKDKCVLANEEVVDGACERCGTPSEKRMKEQWMLAITKYAERLDKDLDETTYLEKIKIQQRNWVGLSEGSELTFTLKNNDGTLSETFKIFTTRADTIFGCTYCVMAPEHPLIARLISLHAISNGDEVLTYKKEALQKTDIDRSAEGKEKTGVCLKGIHAINPATNEVIPVYVADYVLPHYGTGAIMAVPAHDVRDHAFAVKYNISEREVIAPETGVQQENPEIRKSVVAIVWNKKNNTFLTLNWGKSLGGTLFIGGGVEGGEDVVAAAIREIKEETGYVDVSLLGKTGLMYHNYFAHSKNVGRRIEATGLLFELTDETQVPLTHDESEKNKFILEWVAEEKIRTDITDELHALTFSLLVQGKMFTGDGILINSGEFTGIKSSEARIAITQAIGGNVVKKSKLRDWVFARQRYWGEPIPIVYDEKGVMYPVHASELPITLPQVDKYEPTDNGESPLYQVPDWVNVKGRLTEDGFFIQDKDGMLFRRETDTMPQWAGSSWYFIRYIDPHNTQEIGNKDLLSRWLPVNWYNGGMEHTTLHLLYSRFWYKFLYDIGIVPTSEPYYKRTSHGMILGEGGIKMSKSLGNVVSPDGVINEYGADTLRLYEMFIGPFDQSVAWNPQSIIGVRRFIERLSLLPESVTLEKDAPSLVVTHQTIKKITDNIDTMGFNTCVSQMMIWLNAIEKGGAMNMEDMKAILSVMSPFVPHVVEEVWSLYGFGDEAWSSAWPKYDEKKLFSDEVSIALQIGGKMRGVLPFKRGASDEEVMSVVRETSQYKKYVGENTPKKVIIIKDKIVNIVI